MKRLLVIANDPATSQSLETIFVDDGFEVFLAEDGPAGVARVITDDVDVAIVAINVATLDGIEVLERLKATKPILPIVMLTDRHDASSAVRVMRLGAFECITTPIDPDTVRLTIGRALETRALMSEVDELRRRDGGELEALMGPSSAVQRITEQVRMVAATSFSVLILGETGTGKEIVASAVHRKSKRRDKPLVALDCGAIPEPLLESELFGHEKGAFTGADRRRAGHFHLAENGTLFLDEIGNLPLGLQAKLLRVLESRQLQAVGGRGQPTPIDVRFVAATNHDLQARVKEGHFRADLYYRIAQYTIQLPPLRERPGDIPHLAERFMREVAIEVRRPIRGICPQALDLLTSHSWPGNVRELRNVIRQAVLESTQLVLDGATIQGCLGTPAAVAAAQAHEPALSGRSLKEIAEEAAGEAERWAISQAMRATHGNKSEAARMLRVDFKTLHLKMKSLGLRAHEFRLEGDGRIRHQSSEADTELLATGR
jgi:DNA-binding NtrC family response regulator